MGKLGRDVTTARLKGELETTPLKTLADKATFGAVPGQVESATAARKRADDTAKALLEAMGGAEGAAAMSMEDRTLDRNKILASINALGSQAKVAELNAIAKFAPASIAKQAATLSTFQGHVLGYMVRDPITGEEITFGEYMKLNNTEGEDQYPLTGSNAGSAGNFHGTYLNNQRQIDELFNTVDVQVNVPGAVGGAVGGTGGGAGGALPSAIDPSKMTPDQARTATSQRIDEIHARVNVLNEELNGLGDPGATMPAPVSSAALWGGAGGVPTYSGPQPATIQYNNQKEQQITTDIAALKKELNQLYALKI